MTKDEKFVRSIYPNLSVRIYDHDTDKGYSMIGILDLDNPRNIWVDIRKLIENNMLYKLESDSKTSPNPLGKPAKKAPR